MKTRLEIRTGSRLHLGPLAVGAPSGRRFGGVGLMIDQPGYHLRAEPAHEWTYEGPAEVTARLRQFADRFRLHIPDIPSLRLTVLHAGPSHAGLGSGTQIGLAVARLLSEFARTSDLTVDDLAHSVGRGQRSALGVHGFVHGGFLVEGGKLTDAEVGALAARLEFPVEWRVILVQPPRAVGLSGAAEQQAFEALAPMPHTLTTELCRIVLMELLPALTRKHFEEFAHAVGHFSRLVGDYFAPQQGGWFADRRMEALALDLETRGWLGVAQSSWGPTIAIFCPSEAAAEQLIGEVLARPPWSDCQTRIVSGLNHGAELIAAD